VWASSTGRTLSPQGVRPVGVDLAALLAYKRIMSAVQRSGLASIEGRVLALRALAAAAGSRLAGVWLGWRASELELRDFIRRSRAVHYPPCTRPLGDHVQTSPISSLLSPGTYSGVASGKCHLPLLPSHSILRHFLPPPLSLSSPSLCACVASGCHLLTSVIFTAYFWRLM
jgi:hypothetical protein